MNEVKTFIEGVGFPIFISCALGYALYKILISLVVPIFERFLKTLDTFVETNKTLVETNSTLADKLDKKMDRVLEEVSK